MVVETPTYQGSWVWCTPGQWPWDKSSTRGKGCLLLVTFPKAFLRLFSLVSPWVCSVEGILCQLPAVCWWMSPCSQCCFSLGTCSPATVALPTTHWETLSFQAVNLATAFEWVFESWNVLLWLTTVPTVEKVGRGTHRMLQCASVSYRLWDQSTSSVWSVERRIQCYTCIR